MSRCRPAPRDGLTQRRRHLRQLFERGKGEHALAVRLMSCATASTCGRLCPRLVKGPGAAGPKCVDLATGSQLDLYASLAEPDFACPENLF